MQQISDFGLAAALITRKHTIVEFVPGRRAEWYFNDSVALKKDVMDYFNGELMVNATDYFQSLRRLKSMLNQ